MEFTSTQKLAIELRNRNILVSAAAGSGKTATLTERIIRLLTDKEFPCDITSMLIVTFTRAAAAELRTRISRELGKALVLDPSNNFLAKQLTSLGSADICTIDSYYLSLVKSNFQRLNLPAKFRLADETELEILRYETMNAVIDRRYRTDKEFSFISDEITTARSESKLADQLLEIYNKITTLPQGISYLSYCAEQYTDAQSKEFFETDIGNYIRQSAKDKVENLIKRCSRLLGLIEEDNSANAYGHAISSDLSYLEILFSLLEKATYEQIREYIFDYSPASLGRISSGSKSEFTESIKDERNEIKEQIQKFKDREFAVHPDDIHEICIKSAKLTSKIQEIIKDFIDAYSDEKSSRYICEFSDLKKYALELLIDKDGNPTQIAIEEQKKYSHIFVDEYQDTDAIQDLVFNTISNGSNLFFVGDIKQSIYSFRGAEPSIFSRYRKLYTPAECDYKSDSPLSVFMSENFRCSPNIISFTNAVCSYLFRECEGNGKGIGYLAQDDLVASRLAPYSEESVKIVLLEEAPESDIEDPSCAYIISEIKRLLSNDKKCNGDKYIPKDIAVLTRSNRDASKVASALAKAGIPYANSTGSDLFENSEVLLMFSLLSAADNPQRDIPLASVLRSPIFGFTLTELVKIKFGRNNISLYDSLCDYADSEEDISLKKKCLSAISRLDKYRTEAEALPVHLFMRFLWKDTNALTFAGSDEESKKRTPTERRRNLRKFYDYARKYEASSYKGLHDFVEYVSGIISQNTKITDEDAVTDNTVQIMTVHKSKGLEFPVVFLYGAEKNISDQDSKKNMIFAPNDSIGIAFKVSDVTGLGQLESPFRIALSNQIAERSSEEEIRILYVALTRARDVLYVVASGKEGFAENKLQAALTRAEIGGIETIAQSRSWIDRILLGLAADSTNNSYQILTPLISCFAAEEDENIEETVIIEEEVAEICNKLYPALTFVYPYSSDTNIPAKVSVSKLYPEMLNELDEYSDIIKKVESLESRKPRFMSDEDSAAAKGTATHLFLQFCDFSRLTPDSNTIEEEVARLIEAKFIPKEVQNLIRVNEISRFIKTDLFKKIRNAREMHREFRFNIFLPAGEFTDEPILKSKISEKEILVQGVIDLCFVDDSGNLVLCDYKTDRIPKEFISDIESTAAFLSERHSQQLTYYAKAIEKIMSKKPDKILIYSLHCGCAVEIEI